MAALSGPEPVSLSTIVEQPAEGGSELAGGRGVADEVAVDAVVDLVPDTAHRALRRSRC